MSEKNQISGTFAAIFINATGAAMVFILNLYIARNSPVEVYGSYLLVMSVLTVASLVSMLGFDNVLSKLIPEYSSLGSDYLLKGVVVFGFIVVFLASVIAALVLYASGVISVGKTVLFIFPALVLSFYLQSVFRAFKKVVLSRVFDQILRPVIFVCLLFVCGLFLDGELNISYVIACFSVSVLVSLVVASLVFYRGLYPQVMRSGVEFKVYEWLSLGGKMLVISLGFVFLAELDVIMVGFLLDGEAVAMVGVSLKIASVSLLGLQAANIIGAPMISEAYVEGDKRKLNDVVRLVSRFSLILATLFFLCMIFFGKNFLSLFGDEFVSAYPVTMIYCLGFWVSAFFGPCGYLLSMTGRENINLYLVYAVLIANILLSIPAIIIYGVQGAAIVTVTLLALRNILAWFIAKRELGVSSSAFL